MNLDNLGICLVTVDDSTVVDPRRITAMTCENYAGGQVTRIYLEASNEPIRVTMALEDVVDKIREGVRDLLDVLGSPQAPLPAGMANPGVSVSGSGGTTYHLSSGGGSGGSGANGRDRSGTHGSPSSSAAIRQMLIDGHFSPKKGPGIGGSPA